MQGATTPAVITRQTSQPALFEGHVSAQEIAARRNGQLVEAHEMIMRTGCAMLAELIEMDAVFTETHSNAMWRERELGQKSELTPQARSILALIIAHSTHQPIESCLVTMGCPTGIQQIAQGQACPLASD